MYDPKCEELAKYFFEPTDVVGPTEANVAELAQEIQNTIEIWFTEKEQGAKGLQAVKSSE